MQRIKINKNYEIKLPSKYFDVGDEIIFEKYNDNTVRIKKV